MDNHYCKNTGQLRYIKINRVIVLLILILFILKNIEGQASFSNENIMNFAGASTLPISDTLLLEEFLKIKSFSNKEAEAGRYLMDICKKSGLHIYQFGDQDGNFNFAASLYELDEGRPNLIFMNHLDVSLVGSGTKWIHPPFDGKIINDEIWGRGAFDNKGLAVIQLSAISHFVESSVKTNFPFNITLLSTSCEENQCTGGIRFVLENYFELLNPWLVISEGPPGLDSLISNNPGMAVFSIATSQKKALWLKMELTTRTNGHSSVPPFKYANQQMVRILSDLTDKKDDIIYINENKIILKEFGRLEGGIKGFVLKNPVLFKPLIKPNIRKHKDLVAIFSNTITITGISNPTMVQNVIPDKIVCLLDCRLLPGTDSETFISNLRKIIKNKDVHIERIFESPEVNTTSHNHPAYQKLGAAIRDSYGESTPVLPIMLPNFTDGMWFRQRGIPVFEITPVFMKRELMNCIHGIDERLPLVGLSQGTKVFVNFINSLISGEIRP
ncbi:MAG: M20/M25/M40 family metallo-hydrolase [Saprospiraceae bacterium]